MYRKMLLILPVILLGFVTSGCYQVNGEFLELKNEILSSTGSSYNRDVEFALGKASISIVRAFASLDNKDDEIIKNISGIQIGVYKRIRLDEGDSNLFQRINDRLENNGWKYFVREKDHNEMNIIYYRSNDEETLGAMFIISLDKEKLTLVEIRGDLRRIVIAAIREKGDPIEASGMHNSHD